MEVLKDNIYKKESQLIQTGLKDYLVPEIVEIFEPIL